MCVAFTIDEQPVSLGRVWVHLQRPKTEVCSTYELHVPLNAVIAVFGSRKPEDVSWNNYLWSEIKTLGSFIVEAYFDYMRNYCKEEKSFHEWIIVTVDQVLAGPDGIRLLGKAVPLNPAIGVPELKTLE
jgi:hypothetical protein